MTRAPARSGARALKIVLAVGCLLAASPSVGAPASGAETPDIRPFLARTITPSVHLLSLPGEWYGPAISNVILIEQSDGFVVIDTGITAANGRAIVRYARSLSAKPIKAVAITHWHNDHPQGVSAIRDAYPKVRIIATTGTEAGMLGPEGFDVGYSPSAQADAAVAKRVADLKAQYSKLLDDPATDAARKARIHKALAQFDEWESDFRGTYIVPPTETFDHRLVLADRDNPVELMFLGRANTAGDLVAWIPRQKVVASGDIVVSPQPFGFGSYPADWIRTIGKLESLPFKVLIPGHGEPQTDRAYLDKLVQAISDVRTQVGQLAKAGLSLEEIQKKVDLSKSEALFGNSKSDRASFESFFAEPMIVNAYKEALGQPIIQGEGNTKPTYTETPPKPHSLHHRS